MVSHPRGVAAWSTVGGSTYYKLLSMAGGRQDRSLSSTAIESGWGNEALQSPCRTGKLGWDEWCTHSQYPGNSKAEGMLRVACWASETGWRLGRLQLGPGQEGQRASSVGMTCQRMIWPGILTRYVSAFEGAHQEADAMFVLGVFLKRQS